MFINRGYKKNHINKLNIFVYINKKQFFFLFQSKCLNLVYIFLTNTSQIVKGDNMECSLKDYYRLNLISVLI